MLIVEAEGCFVSLKEVERLVKVHSHEVVAREETVVRRFFRRRVPVVDVVVAPVEEIRNSAVSLFV